MASRDTPTPTDEELLERQTALQAEARDFAAEHGSSAFSSPSAG
jgi:hypothetical protein